MTSHATELPRPCCARRNGDVVAQGTVDHVAASCRPWAPEGPSAAVAALVRHRPPEQPWGRTGELEASRAKTAIRCPCRPSEISCQITVAQD